MKTKLKYLAALALASAVSVAQAAPAVDISADAAQAKTDIMTTGGIIIGVMVSIAVISWIRRVVR